MFSGARRGRGNDLLCTCCVYVFWGGRILLLFVSTIRIRWSGDSHVVFVFHRYIAYYRRIPEGTDCAFPAEQQLILTGEGTERLYRYYAKKHLEWVSRLSHLTPRRPNKSGDIESQKQNDFNVSACMDPLKEEVGRVARTADGQSNPYLVLHSKTAPGCSAPRGCKEGASGDGRTSFHLGKTCNKAKTKIKKQPRAEGL